MKRYGVVRHGRIPARAVLAVVAGTLVSACGVDPFALSNETVTDQRARWIEAGIVDYEYAFRRSCECVPEAERPTRVRVRGGTVLSVIFSDSGENATIASGYPTVDELFDLIEDAIRQGAAGLMVSYDALLGYPTAIRIDYDLEVADDEIAIEATDLVAN